MTMIWFMPLGVLLGLAGTKTSLEERHFEKGSHAKGWLLMFAISWAPMLFWLFSQFIAQY